MIDSWLYVLPAAMPSASAARAAYGVENIIDGHWQPFQANYEVFNVLGESDAITALQSSLGADCVRRFDWVQGPGQAARNAHKTIPGDVVVVMNDHVLEEADGTVISTTPASLESPNWGHVFLGQGQRVFAGQFSNQFSGQFL